MFEYVFYKLFDVNLTREEQRHVFIIMDADGSSELGFAEFVKFIAVTKQIENLILTSPTFVAKAFPKGTKGGRSRNFQRLFYTCNEYL